MADVMIAPADAARSEDVELTFTDGGDGPSCQCQWWMIRNKDFNSTTRDEKTALLHAELQGDEPPGLVAYVDGAAAGWVRVGPRTSMHRIPHTKLIAAHSPEPFDDPPVWAISCFSVRREFRGHGLTRSLLRAAVERAEAHGARVVEAYPVDTDPDARVSSSSLYIGTLSTFLAEGFTLSSHMKPTWALVHRTLGGAA